MTSSEFRMFNYRADQMANLHGARWINDAEFYAISGLIPLVAAYAPDGGYYVACISPRDQQDFELMVCAIRTADLEQDRIKRGRGRR